MKKEVLSQDAVDTERTKILQTEFEQNVRSYPNFAGSLSNNKHL